jgi:hypothetical protein
MDVATFTRFAAAGLPLSEGERAEIRGLLARSSSEIGADLLQRSVTQGDGSSRRPSPRRCWQRVTARRRVPEPDLATLLASRALLACLSGGARDLPARGRCGRLVRRASPRRRPPGGLRVAGDAEGAPGQAHPGGVMPAALDVPTSGEGDRRRRSPRADLQPDPRPAGRPPDHARQPERPRRRTGGRDRRDARPRVSGGRAGRTPPGTVSRARSGRIPVSRPSWPPGPR